MDKKFILLTLIVLASICVRAQTETVLGEHRIKGIVRTEKGEVIAGLNLFVKKGDQTRSFSSNIYGEFELSLQPGDYVITVNKVNSPDFKAFVKILDKGLNPNNIEFVFDPSRVCCFSRTGTPFPRPTSLPKPAFPPAARAVRATGEVVVDLFVDKDGKATSAKAETGHPLLRASAVVVANGSRFETNDINGEREATLTYVFLTDEQDEKKRITRYTNPFRIEVINQVTIIDTINSDPRSDSRSFLSRLRHFLHL